MTAATLMTACNDDAKEPNADNAMAKETEATKTTSEETQKSKQPKITPIEHATMVMEWGDQVIYVDPVGGKEAFEGQPAPDLILVTDIHGDHMDQETILAVRQENKTRIIAPQAVADKLDKIESVKVLNNGETFTPFGMSIRAVPMYNTTEERKKFHEKGRGNGYVVSKSDFDIYISGDTEPIPEMEDLSGIDMAFICMNLPYTMTVEQAIDATMMFKPEVAVPFHYRDKDGLSDVDKYKKEVESASKTKVKMMDWYPER